MLLGDLTQILQIDAFNVWNHTRYVEINIFVDSWYKHLSGPSHAQVPGSGSKFNLKFKLMLVAYILDK